MKANRQAVLMVDAWPAILIGLCAFFLVTGGLILRPTNVKWLLEGDPAAASLGWSFFRASPVLQWPLGANPNYGLEAGSSVVFSDSIPLLALALKPFSPLLPAKFQYFGLWLLGCFILQAYFAWRLLSLATTDRRLLLIGTGFFVIAPPFLWRANIHLALCGQWVLLAALFLYFAKEGFSFWRWLALLVITILVHPYLGFMVAAVFLTDIVQRLWSTELSPLKALFCIVAAFAGLGLVMWTAGYFMLGTEVGAPGFGFYRMNLLSLVDPDTGWSMLLPDQAQGGGDYEGFNFLGVGVLGLVFVAAAALARRRRIDVSAATAVPLLLMSLLLTLYAVSNHVALGSRELFAYSISDALSFPVQALRVSGRMFWPVYYLIIFSALFVIFRCVKPSLAVAICGVFLLVQLVDESNAISSKRSWFMRAETFKSPMTAALWRDLARKYRRIALVQPDKMVRQYLPIAEFAARKSLATNASYLARVSPEAYRSTQNRFVDALTRGNLDPEVLYIVANDEIWTAAVRRVGRSDVAGVLDGFRIVAPGLRDCASCNQAEISKVTASLPH